MKINWFKLDSIDLISNSIRILRYDNKYHRNLFFKCLKQGVKNCKDCGESFTVCMCNNDIYENLNIKNFIIKIFAKKEINRMINIIENHLFMLNAMTESDEEKQKFSMILEQIKLL